MAELELNAREAALTGARGVVLGIAANFVLAIIKGVTGFFGHSQALIADAVESVSDVLSSLVVLAGIRMAGKPADKTHPYGHGKFEPLAAVFVSATLMAAAILIAVTSFHQLGSPNETPENYTLYVLIIVIAIKETLFRRLVRTGETIKSLAIRNDANHHRSDAITSMAALVGIAISIIGGEGYESADDFAALIAALVIGWTAVVSLRPALAELLDAAPEPNIALRVREVAESVSGVYGTHKCQVRKLGFDYFVDLDILCDPEATIRVGHEIAHEVGEAVHRALPSITKVLVHVEPRDDFGRRSRD